MEKECDAKSVGIIVWRDNPETHDRELLLIERGKWPPGYATLAGHLDQDGDDYEKAAIRGLEEETGLKATSISLRGEGVIMNPCRRGGKSHYWKLYITELEGDARINRSEDETKSANWYNHDQVEEMARRTKQYLDGKISGKEWEASPGLEPVWLEWFQDLAIVWP